MVIFEFFTKTFFFLSLFLVFLTELATGIFRPAAPFQSMSTIPSNAIVFGSLLAVQRCGCLTMEMIRSGGGHHNYNKKDYWNDLFGGACVYPYYMTFLSTDKRYLLHNRVVGSLVILSVIYANTIA